MGKLRRTAIQAYPDSVSVCGIGAPVEVCQLRKGGIESACCHSRCQQARRPLEKSIGVIFESANHLLRKVRVRILSVVYLTMTSE